MARVVLLLAATAGAALGEAEAGVRQAAPTSVGVEVVKYEGTAPSISPLVEPGARAAATTLASAVLTAELMPLEAEQEICARARDTGSPMRGPITLASMATVIWQSVPDCAVDTPTAPDGAPPSALAIAWDHLYVSNFGNPAMRQEVAVSPGKVSVAVKTRAALGAREGAGSAGGTTAFAAVRGSTAPRASSGLA